MNQVEVKIMGQGYLLGCPEDGHDRLMKAVDRVDTAMCRIRDAGKVKARDRIAVLAALNLAFDLTDQADQIRPDEAAKDPSSLAPATAPAEPASRSEAPQAEAGNSRDDERVRALIARIDRVLSSDGQLI